jgi:hypothetical protein
MSRQLRSASREICAIAKVGRYIPVTASRIYSAFINCSQSETVFSAKGSLHQLWTLVARPAGWTGKAPPSGREAQADRELIERIQERRLPSFRLCALQLRSSTICARKTPMLVISTSSVSPAFIHSGGLRPWPTPSGVPVEMTSPGTSAVKSEQNAIICGIE